MTIEWESNVPENVRLMILEGAKWVFTSSSVEWNKLLIARMQNIYLLGIQDGLLQAQKSTADALSKIGTVRL